MVDAAQGRRPRYLVVNGDESEPATFKDHMLIERDPHQIIEGMVIAAYADPEPTRPSSSAGASSPWPRAPAAGLQRGLRARGARRATSSARGFSLDVVIHPGAGAYICGEETALLESLEGKRGFPRIKPPYFPAAIGLYGEPTVVNNVETMSNLPWIMRNGGEAFAALGAGLLDRARGCSRCRATSSGPGWYEIEMAKTTFRDLIYDPSLGGGIAGGKRAEGLHPGGRLGAVVRPEHLDLGLDQDAVGKAGSMLGSGSIMVMDETTCPVRAAWRIARFFHRESCGQCTPCREGQRLAREDHAPDRGRATAARTTSTC